MQMMNDAETVALAVALARKEARFDIRVSDGMLQKKRRGEWIDVAPIDTGGNAALAGAIASLSHLKGNDGRDVEFALDGTRIGVRHVGDEEWQYTPDLTGRQGERGEDGADGVGIVSAHIGDDGRLFVTLTSGETVDAGIVPTVGVASARIAASGNLIIAMTDGREIDTGRVVGADGSDGVGVASAKVSASGDLILTMTNGDIVNAGRVKPNDGKPGKPGENGRGLEFRIDGDRIGIRREGDTQWKYTTSLKTRSGGGGRGKSAYEVAVANGFVGTEVEWLASLQGQDAQETFETVSKNLAASAATLGYTDGKLTSLTYASGIVKTLNYTGDVLTSIVLSGATPGGIALTKTLGYTDGNLTSVAYS